MARRCAQHGACGQTPDGPSCLAPGLAPPASRAIGRPNLRLRGGRPKDGRHGDASQEETLGGWAPEEDATKEAKEAWAETRCSALLLCTSLPASRTPAALGTAAYPCAMRSSLCRPSIFCCTCQISAERLRARAWSSDSASRAARNCPSARSVNGCLDLQSVAEGDRGGRAENGPRPSRLDAKHYRLGEVPPVSHVTALLLTDTNDINNLDTCEYFDARLS